MSRKFFWTMFAAILLATVSGRLCGSILVLAVQP